MPRLLLLWVALAAVAGAQPKPDQKEFNLLLDQIRAAVRAEDWPEASRLTMRLNATLLNLRTRSQASPLLELQHLEILAGRDSITRNPLLPRMARAAFAANEWARAEVLANEALEAARHGVFWWTGDAIHQGNIVLGSLALRESKVDAAKRCLSPEGRARIIAATKKRWAALRKAKAKTAAKSAVRKRATAENGRSEEH